MSPLPLVVRHQVAVGGRVVDGPSGATIAGARVTLSAKGIAGLRETTANARGLFYFLDLPNGEYALEAQLPLSGTRMGRVAKPVKVSRDSRGNIQPLFVDLPLSATTVTGTVVVAHGKERIVMARVWMKGSGERTATNAEGRYWLRGVESGNRIVQATAPGFKVTSEKVRVGKPGSETSLDLVLERLKEA